MLSSLFRSKGDQYKQSSDRSPFSSPFSDRNSQAASRRNVLYSRRRVAADFDDDDHGLNSAEEDDEAVEEDEDEGVEDDDQDDEDDGEGKTPLLPIFEASYLDALPVYNLTHAIRLLIVPRCETTLTWDQLRSPQVSQFMIKPIQKNITTSHFSRATLYALMANCLQFNKEVQENPGNSGTNALSYDFYPLQGLNPSSPDNATPRPNWEPSQLTRQQTRVARISTLEVAIRTQAKRLLAHPLVVQQLEAIWAGTIVFHSAADNAHRAPVKVLPNQNRGYGTLGGSRPTLQASPDRLQLQKQREHHAPMAVQVRRTVTLYNPRDASLFKLSRLRVPRYRSCLSTCSLAILLGLFVAVLKERRVQIKSLEVLFWFWSAGFMLDEVVGFSDQGFSLYIMSFWNSFDLGILLVLLCYYGLRLYGILADDGQKKETADMAYDVLAINAVLLFPRIFSVLDHYRYFNQLLIAFRMMAMDLMAILILILISCSGFFVAFTLSFGNNDFNAADVAYALFQMIMGFTPAAWDQWSNYNFLGRGTLVLFLFITHFLVVTILITVLTNSFMAIVQNANDEHQFVFAVNTISMVKSDALFSYIAPTNIIAWGLTPLRSCLPFRQFVKINRTVIKVTHFPILLGIFLYERLILRRLMYQPMDMIEQRGRQETYDQFFDHTGALGIFSPKHGRIREPSVATFQKDKALDEVFRRPLRNHKDPSHTVRTTQRSQDRRKKSNVVTSWMRDFGPEETAEPPAEQDRNVVDRLERRRPKFRTSSRNLQTHRDFTAATMSIASDPEEFIGRNPSKVVDLHKLNLMDTSIESLQRETEDGDVSATNDDNEVATGLDENEERSSDKENRTDYFQPPPQVQSRRREPLSSLPHTLEDHSFSLGESSRPITQTGPQRSQFSRHQRNISTKTILYNPVFATGPASSTPSRNNTTARNSVKSTAPESEIGGLSPLGRKTPKRNNTSARARPIMPPRTGFQSTPNLAGLLMLDDRRPAKRPSYAMDLVSDLGDNKAVGGGFLGAMPASFATQMAYAGNNQGQDNEDQTRMGKLMLARMNTLEEGFREVIKEVKDWRKQGGRGEGMRPTMSSRSTTQEMTSGKGSKALGKKRQESEGTGEVNEGAGQQVSFDRGSSV